MKSGEGKLATAAFGVRREFRETSLFELVFVDFLQLAEEENFLANVLQKLLVVEKLLPETELDQSLANPVEHHQKQQNQSQQQHNRKRRPSFFLDS